MGDEVTTDRATQIAAWQGIHDQFKVNETPNGPGSFLVNTNNIRGQLPNLLSRLGIKTLLDAPCGDLNWLRQTQLVPGYPEVYTGWDGVDEIVAGNIDNTAESHWPHPTFECVNLLEVEHLPTVDAIMVRDFMIHLPMLEISLLLDKIRAANIHYLLASTWPNADNTFSVPEAGHDGRPGYWYNEVNLQAAPFNLDGKVDGIVEDDGQHELAVFDLWDF